MLVRLTSVGICGTDLEFATFFPAPAVLGHEGAGVVERVGTAVTTVAPGDNVALTFALVRCLRPLPERTPAYCRRFDALNFSGRRPDGTRTITVDGAAAYAHFLGQSAFATTRWWVHAASYGCRPTWSWARSVRSAAVC